MYYIKHKYTIRSGLWAVIFSHFYSTLFYLIQSAVVAVAVAFSLYRITELLSRIKYENQGIFYSDFYCGRPIFQQKTADLTLNPNPDSSPTRMNFGKNQFFIF